jgi:hypothetical protein
MESAVGKTLYRSSRTMRSGGSGRTACALVSPARPCRLAYSLQSGVSRSN